MNYEDLYVPEHKDQVQQVNTHTISQLFFYGLSLSATKAANASSWSMRVNPSSGNLHPIESYIIMNSIPGDESFNTPGTYHYNAKKHELEKRFVFQNSGAWAAFTNRFKLYEHNKRFFIGLSAIHWRESWKYGERAFRYSHLDMGHAIAAIRMSARMLGWRVYVVGTTSSKNDQFELDNDCLSSLLGLNHVQDFYPYTTELNEKSTYEMEYPEVLLLVDTTPVEENALASYAQDVESIICVKRDITDTVSDLLTDQGTSTFGRANQLSAHHHPWHIIHEISMITSQKSLKSVFDSEWMLSRYKDPISIKSVRQKYSAQQIVRQRRSALDFDGDTSISRDDLYQMLLKVTPKSYPSVWESFYTLLYPRPNVNLALFLHRVDGLVPGLYVLVRNEQQVQAIQNDWKCRSVTFEFTKAENSPDELHLYRLFRGNAQQAAAKLSCEQDIAGDSAFSFGMIANMYDTVTTYGPASYKHLYWECGYIGHVMYLEAEAVGLRATGIGCFFDDPVAHTFFEQMLDPNLSDSVNKKYQSLYHFTVGGPIEDTRIQSLSPY
jgi:SagB-type dehydrogenase family enzyme